MFTFIAALNCALRISCFNRDTQFLKSLFPAKVLFPVMSYVFVFNSRFSSDIPDAHGSRGVLQNAHSLDALAARTALRVPIVHNRALAFLPFAEMARAQRAQMSSNEIFFMKRG